MGLLYEETFYVQVRVGARWEWLRSFPPGDPARGTLISVPERDRRIRLGLKAPEYARGAVELWAKCAGVPEGTRVTFRVVASSWRGERVLNEDVIEVG